MKKFVWHEYMRTYYQVCEIRLTIGLNSFQIFRRFSKLSQKQLTSGWSTSSTTKENKTPMKWPWVSKWQNKMKKILQTCLVKRNYFVVLKVFQSDVKLLLTSLKEHQWNWKLSSPIAGWHSHTQTNLSCQTIPI